MSLVCPRPPSAPARRVRRPPDIDHVQRGRDPSILGAFGQGAANLVLWDREMPLHLAEQARRLATRDLRIHERIAVAGAAAIFTSLRSVAPALVEDVAALIQEFGAATGARDVDVELEAHGGDACRLFHVDFVAARLITTYVGPGTQWLPDRAVNRGALGHVVNADIKARGTRPRALMAGHVGLFRGDGGAGWTGRGVVHRSPPVSGRGMRRLVLKIDFAGAIAGARDA